jgi:hypothetical protein
MGKYKLLVIMMIAAVLLGSCATKTPTAVPTATATQAASAPQATSSGLLPAQVDLPGCTVVSPFPTPGPTQESLYPSQKDTDWSKGPDNAKVTIIEYSDFQ